MNLKHTPLEINVALFIGSRVLEMLEDGEVEDANGDFFRMIVGSTAQILRNVAHTASPEMRQQHPGVNWNQLGRIPDQAMQEYMDLDEAQFQTVLTKHLPLLIEAAEVTNRAFLAQRGKR
jgi:hypothetical protein